MKRLFPLLFIALALLATGSRPPEKRSVVVSKAKLMLYVLQDGDTLWSAPVGVGLNRGNKQRVGDMCTPEGSFEIASIEKASHWTHDFGDGAGQRKGAYGDWFIRLKVPRFRSIGIHGTCFPESIGTRCSEGCIRMHNDDLNTFRNMVTPGMVCTIEPDEQ